jgi:preprotein translocase subunit SecB
MTEETKPAEQPQQNAPKLQVLNQYIRDLSFENVAIQKGTQVQGQPQITVQVALDAARKSEDVYEVINKVKVESKAGEDVVFILELDYAGQFRIQNVPDNQMSPFLMIECPRMLFPYLRRVIGDITRDGGYPPLNIDNIDYLTLYRQKVEQLRAMKEKEGAQVS